MNKIVYAALLVGLTSTAGMAQSEPTSITCTGTPSKTCLDAQNAYNAVQAIPAMIDAIQAEAGQGGTEDPTFKQAQTLLQTQPMSNFMNYVTNCQATSPMTSACSAAVAAQQALAGAVSAVTKQLAASTTDLTIFSGTIKEQFNDPGMVDLVNMVTALNTLDAAVVTAAAIPIPSGPTMKRK